MSCARPERLVPLGPQVVELLVYLVQHPGRTVPTEELLAHLYPNEFAPVERLTNAVAQARKALGDTGQTQRYIQTVRRRGCRFIVPVTVWPPVEPAASGAQAAGRGEPEPRRGSHRLWGRQHRRPPPPCRLRRTRRAWNASRGLARLTPSGASLLFSSVTSWSRPRSRRSLIPKTSSKSSGPTKPPVPR